MFSRFFREFRRISEIPAPLLEMRLEAAGRRLPSLRTRRGVSRRVLRVISLPDTKINAFLTREGDRMPYDTIPAAKTHYIIDYIKIYKIPKKDCNVAVLKKPHSYIHFRKYIYRYMNTVIFKLNRASIKSIYFYIFLYIALGTA